MAANPQTKPIDLGCESAENWQLSSTSTIAIKTVERIELWELPSTYPTLCSKEIMVPPKLGYFPLELCPKLWTSPRQVDGIVNKTRPRSSLWITPMTAQLVVAGRTQFITRWSTVTR